MEHDIIKPESTPKTVTRATSMFGCFLAAIGATLACFFLFGSAAAATVWAFAKLLGLPDTWLPYLIAVGMLPVLCGTIWTWGRAWHVERRLASGQDVDVPVFSMMHYLKRS